MKKIKYNTRLLKAGALINEMRTLVCVWDESKNAMSVSSLAAQGFLGKPSRKREYDILKYAFVPRFIKGNPPQAWKILRALEDQNVCLEILLPVYYWIITRNEPLLYDFICETLEAINKISSFITVDEVVKWIKNKLNSQNIGWSDTAIRGVAKKILAILRDFGFLQGKIKKRFTSFYFPVESFVYIAFCLSKEGFSGINLLQHKDWKLFFFTHSSLERMFLEADKKKLLKYLVAGGIVNIEFPATTYEEMSHVIASRAS